MAKDSNEGCVTAVGVAVFLVIGAIMAIPKEVWIVLGIGTGGVVVVGAGVAGAQAVQRRGQEARERKREEQAAVAAAAERKRVASLGVGNAARIDSARAAVTQVVASEAARTGWLGEVDFSTDLTAITENFRKATALRKVHRELAALASPTADDRRILGEAKATAEELEEAANERVDLILKCATEARRVDESLRREREDAKTAEQRAELHAKLSAMLYGIEVTPQDAQADWASERVMARVAAYREIKDRIQRARDNG